MGRTKDESFMLKLYEEALKQPAIDKPIDKYHIGESVGLQKTATDTICNLLAQANFIKKEGLKNVSLTPHGIKLIDDLKGNR